MIGMWDPPRRMSSSWGWFRQAGPYIRGHRGSTFAVVISGEIVASPHLDSILQAAMEAAGGIRLTIEAKLSPGLPILNLRRLGYNSRWHELGIFVASGNFLAAKRRRLVNGIDFGATGEVKKKTKFLTYEKGLTEIV